jgi:putative ABC transport system substrate-binding protein
LRSISLALGTLALPLAGRAQEPGRTYRLGGLFAGPRDAPQHVALFDGLRRVGFVLGQNLDLDVRGYGLRTDRFPDVARELVKAKVDIILCGGDPAIRAAQQATATIPILAITEDMVGSGLVRSLANPGGNTTGVSILATQLDGKRQDLLIEAVAGLRRLGALTDSNTAAPRRCRMQHVLAGSSCRSIGSPRRKTSCRPSTRRRIRVPQRSTCWRHLFSS